MKVAIIGAGKVGAALCRFFCEDDDVSAVILCDRNGMSLSKIEDKLNSSKLRTHRVGIEKEWSIKTLIRGFDFLISALPPEFNTKITRLALDEGINYIDLGGTNETFEQQMTFHKEAKEKNICIVPNSGFAPGLVNILALHGFESFDTVDTIKIRAAGLPADPKPPLNFQLSFSPAALINEYTNDAIILEKGKIKNVKALEGYEKLFFNSFDKIGEMEAFYTSGQITSLVRMLERKVNYLDFKTIRYPGHRDIIKSLFMLGYAKEEIIHIKANITYRDLLIKQLAKNLPDNEKDIALVQVKLEGTRDEAMYNRIYEMICHYDDSLEMSALLKCASLPTLLASKLIYRGKQKESCGVFPPEKIIPKNDFLNLMKEKGFELSVTDKEAVVS